MGADIGDEDVLAAHHRPQVVQDALGLEWEAVVGRALLQLLEDQAAKREEGRRILLPLDEPVQQLESLANIGDDLDGRLVVAVDLGRREVDVNDLLLALRVPELRRVLDRIVPDRDDQVGLLETVRDVIPRLKASRHRAEIVIVGH